MDRRKYTNKKMNPSKLEKYAYQFVSESDKSRLTIPVAHKDETKYDLFLWLAQDNKIRSIVRVETAFIERCVEKFPDDIEDAAESILKDLVFIDNGNNEVPCASVREYQNRLKREEKERIDSLSQFDMSSDEGKMDYFIRDYNVRGANEIYDFEIVNAFNNLREKGKFGEEQYRELFEVLLNHNVNELDVGWLNYLKFFLSGLKKDGLVQKLTDKLIALPKVGNRIMHCVPGRGVLIEIQELCGGETEEK